MAPKKIFIVLLLFASLAFSLSCGNPTYSEMRVPAVNDLGNGQIVNISLELIGGDGTTYVATPPVVGSMTQESGNTAAGVAAKMAGYDAGTCDSLFKIGSKELETIDGPSAGAAMTLLALSALKNESLLKNFTITGTIEPDGAVGPVGGTAEKAEAASKAGIALFIVPPLGFEDLLILGAVSHNANMTIAQVTNISEAEEIATGRSTAFVSPKLSRGAVPPINSTSSLEPGRFSVFRKLAEGIIASGKARAASVSSMGGGYAPYLEGEIAVAENAFLNGYAYTGANTAFLSIINADFLFSSGSSRESIEARAKKVGECYARAFGAKMTEGNWEWVVGGQLRASWAKKKIEGIGNASFDSEINTLGALRDVIYAEQWCNTSQALVNAPGSGNEISQETFKPIAAQAISDADAYLSGRAFELSDSQWHLDSAKQEFKDGLFGAAAYDGTYALYMSKGYDDFPASTNVKEVLGSAKDVEYRSIWASLYKSQMEYMLATGDSGRASLQLLEFANGLENKTYEMSNAINGGPQGAGQIPAPGASVTSAAANIVIILLILLTLLAIVFVFKQSMEE